MRKSKTIIPKDYAEDFPEAAPSSKNIASASVIQPKNSN
jgi:hypothetical protein